MKANISTDDLKGLPHIVILESESEIKVVTFTGDEGMEKAHEFAQEMILKDFAGCVTVAARVRQLCPAKMVKFTKMTKYDWQAEIRYRITERLGHPCEAGEPTEEQQAIASAEAAEGVKAVHQNDIWEGR